MYSVLTHTILVQGIAHMHGSLRQDLLCVVGYALCRDHQMSIYRGREALYYIYGSVYPCMRKVAPLAATPEMTNKETRCIRDLSGILAVACFTLTQLASAWLAPAWLSSLRLVAARVHCCQATNPSFLLIRFPW